ncbi:MAG TPA: small basic protein [Planctomycetota bacterium]|nr:small basic protein [Planctomycetota bacterium]
MSIHPSLRGVDTLIGERSVFSRVERLNLLMKQGKFKPEGDSVFGLPKVRTRFKVAGAKKVKAPKAEAGAPAAAAPAPAPAGKEEGKAEGKGGKGGKGKK